MMHFKDLEEKLTPLSLAIKNKRVALVYYLLAEKQVNPNYQFSCKMFSSQHMCTLSPLLYVAINIYLSKSIDERREFKEIFLLLLKYGADPNDTIYHHQQEGYKIFPYDWMFEKTEQDKKHDLNEIQIALLQHDDFYCPIYRQRLILNYLEALGYKYNEGGVCFGGSFTAADAFLITNENLDGFRELNNRYKKMYRLYHIIQDFANDLDANKFLAIFLQEHILCLEQTNNRDFKLKHQEQFKQINKALIKENILNANGELDNNFKIDLIATRDKIIAYQDLGKLQIVKEDINNNLMKNEKLKDQKNIPQEKYLVKHLGKDHSLYYEYKFKHSNRYTYQCAELSSLLVESNYLTERGGKENIACLDKYYSRDQLLIYFESLEKILSDKNFPHPISITLSANNHRIVLSYQNKWLLHDINIGTVEPATNTIMAEIVSKLLYADSKDKKYLKMQTNIYAPTFLDIKDYQDSKKVNNAINNIINTNFFTKLVAPFADVKKYTSNADKVRAALNPWLKSRAANGSNIVMQAIVATVDEKSVDVSNRSIRG